VSRRDSFAETTKTVQPRALAVLHFAADSRHYPSMGRLVLAVIALPALLSTPAHVSAKNRAQISPTELVQAINAFDTAAMPSTPARLVPSEVRIVRCVGPDEEPTEFQCEWRQRVGNHWVRRTTWLARDGSVWRDID
jgi:hypothetical protein